MSKAKVKSQVVGARIIDLEIARYRDPEYGTREEIRSITLDNGRTILLSTIPTVDLPVVAWTVVEK